MAAELQNFEQLYIIGKTEAQAIRTELTDWTEGSINDAYVGSSALMVMEAFRYVTDQFRKTFLSSCVGAELDFLATDHFGDDFARPLDIAAVAVVTFSRPTDAAGDVTIAVGTVVKTEADANGAVKSYEVTTEVILTDLTINASVEAVEAGAIGNAEANTITVIETTLSDATVVVTNAEAIESGVDELNDTDYLQWIYDKIQGLPGATAIAIESAAKSVNGIVYATAVSFIKVVKEWDEAALDTVGDSFKVVQAVLYVADANGSASAPLIALVEEEIESVVALGVLVQVLSGLTVFLDWTGQITLNPSGPSYATLSVDAQPIIDTMIEYIQDLPIGTEFDTTDAINYVLGIWGPAGSNDLTAFGTVIPSGNVASAASTKFVPGVVALS